MALLSSEEKCRNQMRELLKLPENKKCVECGTKDPSWCSTNLGIFICMRCAGAHRCLGTHISKVRSIELDKWTPELVKAMKAMGNEKAKQLYEATLPPNYDWRKRIGINGNSEQSALQNFLREKYDTKDYMRKTSDGEVGQVPPEQTYEPQEVEVEVVKAPEHHSQRPPPKIVPATTPVKKDQLLDFINFEAPKQSAPPTNDPTNSLIDAGMPQGKNAIMQLYNKPQVPTPPMNFNTPSFHPSPIPPKPSYPGPNYNINLQPPGYPPNYPPNFAPNQQPNYNFNQPPAYPPNYPPNFPPNIPNQPNYSANPSYPTPNYGVNVNAPVYSNYPQQYYPPNNPVNSIPNPNYHQGNNFVHGQGNFAPNTFSSAGPVLNAPPPTKAPNVNDFNFSLI